MIVPYARRPDWYVIPREWVPEISMAPTVQLLASGQVGVHRSHVALLAERHEEARKLLERPPADMAAREALDMETAARGFKLRSYQHEAREFVLPRRGTLIADQMRVGKTLSAVISHDPADGPLIVAGPLAAREIWVRWMKLRWPDVDPVVLRGRKDDPGKIGGAPCIFCHYDILQSWQNLDGRALGTLVLDECHLLSRKSTRRTQAAMFVANRSHRIIGTTGTPLWNKPGGLWSILTCLNPGAWGPSPYGFNQRYMNPIVTPYGTKYEGTANTDEFRLRMSEVMIRRTWEDIKADLPPAERTVEVADVTEKQLYRLEVLAEKAREQGKRRVFAGDMARFRRLLGQLKVKLAADVASRVMDGDEPVVVWAWHRDVAEKIAAAIKKQGYEAFCTTGADSADTREAKIAAWKSKPVAALVITITIGQVAIDLSHARQAVFAEVDWTPSTVAQAEMRVFSPDKPMAITYLVVDNDIDRRLIATLQQKCETAFELGVPAADTAIDVLAGAFDVPTEEGDMERLMLAFLAGYGEA